MKRTLNILAGAVLCTATGFGSALAADLPKEGSYDYTACWSGTNDVISFSKTHIAFSYVMTGTNRSAVPGGLFDNNSFRCVGSNAVFGKRTSGIATCEAIDQDGDKRLAFFTVSDGKIIRENVTGTGKYEGMIAEGAVQPLGPFPTIKAGTFQNCNRQRGTYKLK